jgi:serine protease Do
MYQNLRRKWMLLFLGVVLGAGLFAVVSPLDSHSAQQAVPLERQIIGADQRPITSLRDLNNAFADVAESVSPAVVTVFSERVLTLRRQLNPFSDFFDDFFFGPRNRLPQQPQEREYRQQGHGSGVIVSADGHILTNNHVVAQADSIYVRLFDQREFPAEVIGTDPKTDIAVIRIDAKNLPVVARGDSDKLRVGEFVLAIGSPLSANLAHTVTSGIVSAKGRAQMGLADYEDFIQTDAAINRGNSGGALVNVDGELVGINAAIVSQSGGFQGIGFAVPSNMAFSVMESLIEHGRVVRGWLGVYIQDVTPQIARAMGLDRSDGALVSEVAPDSPAEQAGLQDGDIVIEINGKRVVNSVQFRKDIATTPPSVDVTLTVLRDGNRTKITVTLGELPSDMAAGPVQQSLEDRLGFRLEPLTRELAQRFRVDPSLSGLIVTDIDETSTAYSAGLRAGDVIRSLNRRRVTSLDDFNDMMSQMNQGDSVLLRVIRDDRGYYVAFTL